MVHFVATVFFFSSSVLRENNLHTYFDIKTNYSYIAAKKVKEVLVIVKAAYLFTDINEATKVMINLDRTSLISSGTNQIKAPNFLAMEMANLAFAYLSSSVVPGATKL